MVQDQLVEYINSQLKAGTSAETIKATLVAAGWQSVDVDDTLKKVQSPAAAASAQPTTIGASSPAAASAAVAAAASTTGPKPISTAKIEPQTIRVSDLVSASDKTISVSAAKPADAKAEATKKFLTPNTSPQATSYQAPKTSSSRGPITTEIILGVLMLVFGALAVYFFLANQGLGGQIATLTAQSTGVSAQVSTLQGQLDASTTALTAEVASVTANNQILALDLSFYAAPLGVVATSTSTTMLTGTVSGSSKSYAITTPNGAKVYVVNSKDPRVVALMQPLVGTTTVQFGGTYIPGADNITLTVINGASTIAPPVVPAASSSTATSTASSTGTAALMIPTPSPSTASTTGQ